MRHYISTADCHDDLNVYDLLTDMSYGFTLIFTLLVGNPFFCEVAIHIWFKIRNRVFHHKSIYCYYNYRYY